MANALAFIGGGLLEGFGKGLAQQGIETGRDKRERALADLEHKRGLERDKAKLAGRRELQTQKLEIEGARPQSGPGKVQADINAGRLPAGTPLRSAGVTVNTGSSGIDYGKPPKGHAWARDKARNVLTQTNEDGFETPIAVAIAGGPVETKAAAGEAAKAVKEKLTNRKVKTMVTTINQAIELVKDSKVPIVGMGSLVSGVPGTPAHDLASSLLTIKANIGFDRLQEMRDSSVTGGALGAINKTEMDLLIAVQGSLEQSQSEGAFVGNLENIRTNILDVVHGEGNWKLNAEGGVTVGIGVGLQEETTDPAVPGQGTTATSPAAPTPLPDGVPTGSVLEGTNNGNPAYRTPDGRLLEVRP